MVSIVIVAHSAKLAAAVRELAEQMVQGGVKIALAAGIDDPENPFGTDAVRVCEAIESVYSDRGVVVLMDLGSALMSAEMALEFLPSEKRDRVRLCEAPLVEGALAAAVVAGAGASLEQVMAEARNSLAAKAAQLSNPRAEEGESSGVPQPGQHIKEIRLSVGNLLGIHARPAAKFAATASRFECEIAVRNLTCASPPVNAKSINQVATLGVRRGHEISIAAEGAEADEALAALQQLVEANFGEAPASHHQSEPPLFKGGQGGIEETGGGGEGFQLTGIGASPGVAIGRAVWYRPAVLEVAAGPADSPEGEWQQLVQAIQTAQMEIQALRRQTASQMGEEEASIFDAHLLCLSDPAVLKVARQQIFQQRLSAAVAWQTVVSEMVAVYRALDDPYLQERSADVLDVGQRVLRLLIGGEVPAAPPAIAGSSAGAGALTTPVLRLSHKGEAGAILVAVELTPSEVAQLDPISVSGLCTGKGSATSHSAILAKSLGIPAVFGVGTELSRIEDGTPLALDGGTGSLWASPDEARVRELQAKQGRGATAQHAVRTAAKQPALTRDGRKVKVMANIFGVADAKIAAGAGAEGVGLLRSEFLYLERAQAPGEEEQLQVYQAIAEILGTRPLTVRTLDAGGDKPLPYLNLEQEANPFLGWRGIRLLLDCPDLLKTQLRAILRASAGHEIKVMFPTIASVREIRAAKEILAAVRVELGSAGIPFDEKMEVGMMVEVPAAVAVADRLAAEVDFFSIGTNDLSQYVMAADRTNPKVATLADAFEPAVLRMIQQTVRAAHSAGIWVGVCGELASHPEATPILVGLGVDELSVSAPAIPEVKAAISRLAVAEAEAIAGAVLQLDSAEAVRQYVAAQLGGE
ncbi:phosphoenolpyruvate--protein phosphotransferase [Kamptonema formosum]|uniref:phosphoenolpyruvate--protein phosphotransferase n=1 Tax=Kamptonema formosum TaxID=331992 RepID=UPI0003479B53|nr:phosphoenolpyruvate--protein phosphotransferase [Oscillatoria sp. PCC 10802]